MKNFFTILFKPFFGKKYLQKFFFLTFLFGLKGMNFGGGSSPKDSGEYYAVKYALKKVANKQLVIFDVGGNKGEYTKLWLESQDNAKVHIFEPSAAAFSFLKTSFSQNPNVVLNNLALSDKTGEAVLFSDYQASGLASLANRDLRHSGIIMGNEEKVLTKTLDVYCEEAGVAQIDFLKLDVEGYEYSALLGAAGMLEQNKIKFIQFEFGGTDIDTRIFFKDFFLLLSPKYNIYRILKNGLHQISKYSELEEIFLTTNYLAELKSHA